MKYDLEYLKQKYGYEIEGMWLPRVTAVTSVFANPFLQKGGNGFLREQFMNAAEWGTLVHSTVGAILRGESINVPSHISISIDAFEQWYRGSSLHLRDPLEDIERLVVDFEHGFAGTLDLIAELKGVLCVIDIKTTTTISKQHLLQTAAYMAAYNKENGNACKKRWILRIDQYQECKGCLAKMRKKYGRARTQGGKTTCNHQWGEVQGEVELRELPDFTKDIGEFLEAKDRWEWKNREWLSKIANYPKTVQEKLYV